MGNRNKTMKYCDMCSIPSICSERQECRYAKAPALGPSDAAACSASPCDLLPPREIAEAAATVAMWMESNGYKNWQLGGVCDRRFAILAGRVRNASEKQEDPIRLLNAMALATQPAEEDSDSK